MIMLDVLYVLLLDVRWRSKSYHEEEIEAEERMQLHLLIQREVTTRGLTTKDWNILMVSLTIIIITPENTTILLQSQFIISSYTYGVLLLYYYNK